jgi:hypothetical protein
VPGVVITTYIFQANGEPAPCGVASMATSLTLLTLASELVRQFDMDAMFVFPSEQRTGPDQHVYLCWGSLVSEGPDRRLDWRLACEGGQCVELAVTEDSIILRTSTNPEATITMTHPEWWAFLAEAKNGRFDEL